MSNPLRDLFFGVRRPAYHVVEPRWTLDRVVLPGLTHWNHPGFYGFFPANAELSSILGDPTLDSLRGDPRFAELVGRVASQRR